LNWARGWGAGHPGVTDGRAKGASRPGLQGSTAPSETKQEDWGRCKGGGGRGRKSKERQPVRLGEEAQGRGPGAGAGPAGGGCAEPDGPPTALAPQLAGARAARARARARRRERAGQGLVGAVPGASSFGVFSGLGFSGWAFGAAGAPREGRAHQHTKEKPLSLTRHTLGAGTAWGQARQKTKPDAGTLLHSRQCWGGRGGGGTRGETSGTANRRREPSRRRPASQRGWRRAAPVAARGAGAGPGGGGQRWKVQALRQLNSALRGRGAPRRAAARRPGARGRRARAPGAAGRRRSKQGGAPRAREAGGARGAAAATAAGAAQTWGGTRAGARTRRDTPPGARLGRAGPATAQDQGGAKGVTGRRAAARVTPAAAP
jgi:hypothetical protein